MTLEISAEFEAAETSAEIEDLVDSLTPYERDALHETLLTIRSFGLLSPKQCLVLFSIKS